MYEAAGAHTGYVLVLWITYITVHPAGCTPTCEGRDDDVYFAHPTNCSRFYQCDNGVAKERPCAPHTVFDASIPACVQEDFTECLLQPVTQEMPSSTTSGLVYYRADVRYPTLDYSSYLSDVKSSHFRNLPEKSESSLEEAVSRNQELSAVFVSATYTGSRPGSVILEVSLAFESDLPNMQHLIQTEADALLELTKNEIGGFFVDGISIVDPAVDEWLPSNIRDIVFKVAYAVGAILGLIVVFLVGRCIYKHNAKLNCLHVRHAHLAHAAPKTAGYPTQPAVPHGGLSACITNGHCIDGPHLVPMYPYTHVSNLYPQQTHSRPRENWMWRPTGRVYLPQQPAIQIPRNDSLETQRIISVPSSSNDSNGGYAAPT